MEFLGVNIHGTPLEIFFSLIACLISFILVANYQDHVLTHERNKTPLKEFPSIMLWCFLLYNAIMFTLTAIDLFSDIESNTNGVPKAYHVMCLFCSSVLGIYMNWICLWTYAIQGPVIKNWLCTVLLYVFATMSVFFSVFSAAFFVRPICFVIGVIMYALPLVMTTMGRKDESIEGMRVDSVEFCVLLVLNGLAWFIVVLVAYKGERVDGYIGITNGIGALLGQLGIIIYRSRNLSADEGDVCANKIHADEGVV